MATTLRLATWSEIETLRTQLTASLATATDMAAAAQVFARAFVDQFSTVALARVFVVVPFRALPAAERAAAEAFAVAAGRNLPIEPSVPVLTLLGTAGVMHAWNDRLASAGHRAIPLIDKSFVEGAPMIAELLAGLKVDLAMLRGDTAVDLRALVGGINQRFFVADAREAVDARGRLIIGARDFVTKNAIRSVFGMGGAYVGGTLVVAIVFTTEPLEPLVVDRYPSFIGTFKIATAALVGSGLLFPPG